MVRLREQARSHIFMYGLLQKRRRNDVNIHTMTIRRLSVSPGLQARLFFYSLLRDIESNHRIETAFPRGLNTGSTEGRRHVAQPLPHPSMPGPCDPYRVFHPSFGGRYGHVDPAVRRRNGWRTTF